MDKEALQIAKEKIKYYKSLKTKKEIEEIPVDILRALYLDKIKEAKDNQADLTTVYLKGIYDEKYKWRDKIRARREHIIEALYKSQKKGEYEKYLEYEKDILEKFRKIEFSIRMLHFHNYITDTQFFNMIEKLKKDIDNSKGE